MTYINIPTAGSAYFQDPVDTDASLPSSATEGEIRLVLDTGEVYYYNGIFWLPIAGGGGGSGSWGTIAGTLSNQVDLQNALNDRVKYRGNWIDSNENYYTNDAVLHNNVVYIAIADQHGSEPPNPTYWTPMFEIDPDSTVTVETMLLDKILFKQDTNLDTGIEWVSEGEFILKSNGDERLKVTSSDPVHAATGFSSGNGEFNKFLVRDENGVHNTINNYGYSNDSSEFNGLRYFTNVESSDADEYKILHSNVAYVNADTDPAHQNWQHSFLQMSFGTDDNGISIGDWTDTKATLLIQDITYTSNRYATDGNTTSIEYIGGATAGNEIVTSPSPLEYVIQIEDGVTTATQILNAIINSNNPGNILFEINYEITGTGSNPQNVFSKTYLSGGIHPTGGATILNVNAYNQNKSDTGFLNGVQVGFVIGNGTDPVRSNKFTAYGGNIDVNEGSVVNNVSFLDYGINVDTTDPDTKIQGNLNGINFYGNFGKVTDNVNGYQFGINGESFNYANLFQASMNVSGDVANSVNTFVDYSNYNGNIQSNYFGLSIQPHIGSTNSFVGVNVNADVDEVKQNAQGIYVDMSNIDVKVGIKPSVTIQDIFYEINSTGSGGNAINIVYVDDTTAGNEIANFSQTEITVHMEDGVSTAQQILTALQANLTIISNITINITGSSSNPQLAQGPTYFQGGEDSGNKQAAVLNGDVQVNGDFSFTGALSLGALNAYASQELVDGGGAPGSIHMIVSSPTVEDNITVNNADILGLNTACLIQVGENSTVNTAFLGVSAMGLPAVVSTQSGSFVDKIVAAAYALSLAAESTGGTVDQVFLVRALALPNGITTVNNLYGFQMDLPFGSISSNTWGIHITPDCENWLKGSLKIGGNSGTTDKVSNSSIGLELENKAFRYANMDSTTRDSLTALPGMVIFNTDTSTIQYYNGSNWV